MSSNDFKFLADNLADIIAMFDVEGRYVYVNKSIEIETGIPSNNFIGKNHRELNLSADLVEIWQRNHQNVLRTGNPISFEFNYNLPQCPSVYQARLIPEKNIDGKVETILAVIRKINIHENNTTHKPQVVLLASQKTSLENNFDKLDLAEIIDVKELQILMDNFYNLTKITTAIIDTDGRILVGAGWQSICTKFHRTHPDSLKNCIESDTELATDIPDGEFKLYKCKNGLWDLATPIIVGGEHKGNLFMGQFFFDDEPIDYEFFRSKARQFGFDEKEYITALENVPRLNAKDLNSAKAFFSKLARSISQLSYSNIKLNRLLDERGSLLDSLSQSEERFRNMFEKTKAIMLLIDPVSGNIVDANDAAAEFYGWSVEQLCTRKIQDINTLSEEEVARERIAALNELRNYFIFPHRLAGKQIRWVEVYSSPILISGKQMLFSLIHDITERKTFQDNLLQSEENIRAILNATTESILMFDRDGKIITANITAAKRLNRSLEDIIGNYYSEFIPAEFAEIRMAYIGDVFNSGKSVQFEDERNGISLYHNYYPVFENNNVVRVVAYCKDVTERKKTEVQLHNTLQRFYLILSGLSFGLLLVTDESKIEFVNQAFCDNFNLKESPEEMMHLTSEEMMEKIRYSYKDPDAAAARIREIVLQGQPVKDEEMEMIDGRTFLRDFVPIRINEKTYGRLWFHFDITKRKIAENQLRKLSSAVQQSPNSIIITDVKGNIEYANPEFTKITGYTLEEILGKNPRIFKSGRTDPAVYKKLWKTILSGKPWFAEFQNKKKSGEIYWESVNIAPVSDSLGTITHFVSVKEDITERKKVEEKLHQLNRTLNALRHSSEAILHASDEWTYMQDVCKIIVEDCGYRMIWIGFAEDDENKTVRPVASAGFEEGYINSLNITWSDTERGQGPTGTAIRTGTPSTCNNMLIEPRFKPWRAEAIKRGYASSVVLPLKDDKKVFGAISIYSGEPDSFSVDEVNLLCELADELAYGISVLRLRHAHELSALELIEHRDKLEQLVQLRTTELSTTNELLKEAQKVANIGSWHLDFAINKLSWSDQVYRIFGIDPADFNPTFEAFLNMIHPDDRNFVAGSYTASIKNKTFYSLDHRIVRPDGEIRIVHQQCITHYNDDGKPIRSLGVVRDITDLKRAEQEIEHHKIHLEDLVKQRTEELDLANRKLKDEIEKEKQVELLLKVSLDKEKELNELKSSFISTTSHEFRTPLTSILSSMQLIQRYRKKWSDEKLDDQFLKVKNSVFNLTKLLDDILTLSHTDSGRIAFNPKEIDLYQFCTEFLEEIKHLALPTHKFNYEFTSIKRNFMLDPKLIKFILVNLVSNAFKYSPDGGRIKLSIASTAGDIKISVSDEGIGIPKKDSENLFKPFFRASNTGEIKGTGLGLSIVNRAVVMHNGTINYQTKIGKGTKFVVIIPWKAK